MQDAEFHDLASRWARLVGALVDALVLILVVVPIGMFILGMDFAAPPEETTLGQDLALLAASLLVYLALNGYLLATRGQSIGKWLAGTRIVSADDGRIPSLWRTYGLRHALIFLLSSFGLVGMLFGLVNALFVFRRDRRCIHDHVAGTVVVRVQDAAPPVDDVETTQPPPPPPRAEERE